MMILSCSDMGETSCGFTAKGETKEAVANKMMDHAETSHKKFMEEAMKSMSSEELKEKMMAKVHS